MIEVGSMVTSSENDSTIYKVMAISNNLANVLSLESEFKYNNIRLDLLSLYELKPNMKVIDCLGNNYIVEKVELGRVFCKDNGYIYINEVDWYKTFKVNGKKYFGYTENEIDIIQDDESSIEKFAELLCKSTTINPTSTKVEVKFDMMDLIDNISRKREKLVRLNELLEDEDIKELLDIEVRVR